MNNFEFTYEADGQRHAEAVEANDLDQVQHYFHLTHPRLAHIINVVLKRTGRETVERPLAIAVA